MRNDKQRSAPRVRARLYNEDRRLLIKWFFMTLAALGLAVLSPPVSASDSSFSYYSGEIKQPIDHSRWEKFIRRYVSQDDDGIVLVAYGQISSQDRAVLDTYISELEAIDPTRYGGDEAFSYWVNLYNALTIEVILDNYPVDSIRDIRTGLRAGPWKRELVKVNGKALSLDDIEHGILREYWDEPRVHYAVNCASIGCPNLALKPYSGDTLDDDLDDAARAFINSPRGVQIDPRGRLKVSSIYRWYAKDFGDNEKEVLDHIKRYAAPDLRKALDQHDDIDSYDYDWSLNEAE